MGIARDKKTSKSNKVLDAEPESTLSSPIRNGSEYECADGLWKCLMWNFFNGVGMTYGEDVWRAG